MKTIGLMGGMSWESTAIYYQLINEMIKERRGGLHSAKMLLWSFDFADIASRQAAGDWDGAGALLAEAAGKLEAAGADGLLIGANTMHLVYPQVTATVAIPVLHIADATAAAIRQQGLKKVGLLATRFIMEQDFYTGRLRDLHGIETLTPGAEHRLQVHDIIYNELCKGVVSDASRQYFIDVIGELISAGAEGIVLGCTEIGMLIAPGDVPVPVFDTARIHAEAAVAFMLG